MVKDNSSQEYKLVMENEPRIDGHHSFYLLPVSNLLSRGLAAAMHFSFLSDTNAYYVKNSVCLIQNVCSAVIEFRIQ